MKLQRADLAILLASVLWGLNFCTVKILVMYLPPLLVGFLRFFLSTLVMMAMLKWMEGNVKVAWRDFGALVVAGVLGFGAQQICFLYGSYFAEASMGALLSAFTSAIMTLVASLVARERMTGLMIGGLLAACGGMVLVVLGKGSLGTITPASWIGLGLYFVAGLLSGLMPLLTRRSLTRYSSLRVTTWTLFVGGVFFIIPGGANVQNAHISVLPPVVIPALLFTAIGATAVTNMCWNYGLARVGVVRLSIYGYLPSILGVLMAAALLGEMLTPAQWLGTALTMGGVLVSQIKGLNIRKFGKSLFSRKEELVLLVDECAGGD
ncbi:membrane protein [Ktedonobacter sp. SOSP1-52]|uniref:DMT family transporter n=1 Tax=Ktedonobacter sp. SOSP1-52 TaxID=2778366 RepID=UPI0019167497|nr:DMT family transporter [Ktedonobacter sp. SOSP1-52]GHO66009.1 membrane protein [Ktedonobacter sp. SOSP1-52]